MLKKPLALTQPFIEVWSIDHLWNANLCCTINNFGPVWLLLYLDSLFCTSVEIIMFCCLEHVHSKGNSNSSCAGTLKLIEQCTVDMSGHKKACKPFGQQCHLRINKATAIRGVNASSVHCLSAIVSRTTLLYVHQSSLSHSRHSIQLPQRTAPLERPQHCLVMGNSQMNSPPPPPTHTYTHVWVCALSFVAPNVNRFWGIGGKIERYSFSTWLSWISWLTYCSGM